MYLPRMNAHVLTNPLVPVKKMTTRPIIVGAMVPRANGSILSKTGPMSLTPHRVLMFPFCRHAPFPLRVSPPGWPVVLGGTCALDLLPLWGNLTCAEVAHHNFRYGIH